MSTETQKQKARTDPATRHSAFAEFSRDERRPAVLLLGALIIAAIFFAIGLWVGRVTMKSNLPKPPENASPAAASPMFP
ncbi:MAG: hypothetical protein ABR577_17200 [Pyrinomonadaceae bacterium]